MEQLVKLVSSVIQDAKMLPHPVQTLVVLLTRQKYLCKQQHLQLLAHQVESEP